MHESLSMYRIANSYILKYNIKLNTYILKIDILTIAFCKVSIPIPLTWAVLSREYWFISRFKQIGTCHLIYILWKILFENQMGNGYSFRAFEKSSKG